MTMTSTKRRQQRLQLQLFTPLVLAVSFLQAAAHDSRPWYIWLQSHQTDADDLETPFYSQSRMNQARTSEENIVNENIKRWLEYRQKILKDMYRAMRILEAKTKEQETAEPATTSFENVSRNSFDRGVEMTENTNYKSSNASVKPKDFVQLFAEYTQLKKADDIAEKNKSVHPSDNAEPTGISSKNEMAKDFLDTYFDENRAKSVGESEHKSKEKTEVTTEEKSLSQSDERLEATSDLHKLPFMIKFGERDETKNEPRKTPVKSPFDEISIRNDDSKRNEEKESMKTPFDSIRTRELYDNNEDHPVNTLGIVPKSFVEHNKQGRYNGPLQSNEYGSRTPDRRELLRHGSLNPAVYNVYPVLRRKDQTYCSDMQRMFLYTCFPGKRLRIDLLQFCREYSDFCSVPNPQKLSAFPPKNVARGYQSGNVGVSSGFGLGLGVLPGFGVSTGWGVNVGPIPGLPGDIGVNMPLNVGILGAGPSNQNFHGLQQGQMSGNTDGMVNVQGGVGVDVPYAGNVGYMNGVNVGRKTSTLP